MKRKRYSLAQIEGGKFRSWVMDEFKDWGSWNRLSRDVRPACSSAVPARARRSCRTKPTAEPACDDHARLCDQRMA